MLCCTQPQRDLRFMHHVSILRVLSAPALILWFYPNIRKKRDTSKPSTWPTIASNPAFALPREKTGHHRTSRETTAEFSLLRQGDKPSTPIHKSVLEVFRICSCELSSVFDGKLLPWSRRFQIYPTSRYFASHAPPSSFGVFIFWIRTLRKSSDHLPRWSSTKNYRYGLLT
jgi:hypothetical protein